MECSCTDSSVSVFSKRERLVSLTDPWYLITRAPFLSWHAREKYRLLRKNAFSSLELKLRESQDKVIPQPTSVCHYSS